MVRGEGPSGGQEVQDPEELRGNVVQRTDRTSRRRAWTLNGTGEEDRKLSADTNKWMVEGEVNI